MKKNAFIFSTREGQTKKIALFIVEQLKEDETDLIDIDQSAYVNLESYDRIVLGASIRYGNLDKKVYQFIHNNLAILESKASSFYCVNLTARKEGKDTPEGSAYIQTFLKKSEWKPELIGVFAGALYYPRYRWFDKVMIRFIMTMTGGETDTSKEVEYTNWEKVSEYAKKVKEIAS